MDLMTEAFLSPMLHLEGKLLTDIEKLNFLFFI